MAETRARDLADLGGDATGLATEVVVVPVVQVTLTEPLVLPILAAVAVAHEMEATLLPTLAAPVAAAS